VMSLGSAFETFTKVLKSILFPLFLDGYAYIITSPLGLYTK
jgi:hypothetical protein